MRTLANECVRRGEGWHIRVLSTDSNQLTLIFSPTHHNPVKIPITMNNILEQVVAQRYELPCTGRRLRAGVTGAWCNLNPLT